MRTRLEGVDMLVVLRGTLTGPLARLAVSSWLQLKRLVNNGAQNAQPQTRVGHLSV